MVRILLLFNKTWKESHQAKKSQVHKQIFSWIEYERQILANAWEYFCEPVAKVSVSTTVYNDFTTMFGITLLPLYQ